MRIKLNRGPLHGKYYEDAIGYSDRFMINAPEKVNYQDLIYEPMAAMKFRRGEYVRSHNSLKNGTVIFEWLGWLDGKP